MAKRNKSNKETFETVYLRSQSGEKASALCREYKVSQASYYAWRKRNKNETALTVNTNNTLTATATTPNGNSGFLLYGSPKFLAEVLAQFN